MVQTLISILSLGKSGGPKWSVCDFTLCVGLVDSKIP